MSALGVRMQAIADALAAQYPARKVRRSFVDFNLLPKTDLAVGVYTVLSAGEEDFTNVNGYNAKDGKQGVRLIGQIQLAEQKDKALAGVAIEEAEFTMIEEVKTFLNNLPATLCLLTLVRWAQSQQMEEPYGWIAAELEYHP